MAVSGRAMALILLTGGGTAGHVNPNLALVPSLRQRGWDIAYAGSPSGIERELVQVAGIPFYGISSGKLRRYFAWQNFIDPFKVLKGVADAYALLGKLRPRVVFSKGGFVAVPVIWAAYLRRVPVVIHESDYTPGLANRLALPVAQKVCVTFPETLACLGKYAEKSVCTGLPIRPELLNGSSDRGRELCQFQAELPILLVIGGSTGAQAINRVVRSALPALLPRWQIIHICGKGNLQPSLSDRAGYRQFEYVTAELPHFLASADLVVSRAGANTIFELLALQKPHLLIPLPTTSSRGDQVLNANSFAKQGYSLVLAEANLTAEELVRQIEFLYHNRQEFTQKMQANVTDKLGAIAQIVSILDNFLG
jgi:UDP-N-acetylglucosamine--N-acetylmuramyl-(pentapeptide) pyrophosphoryl-undecaprenol N-acetylglucosamine transferase